MYARLLKLLCNKLIFGTVVGLLLVGIVATSVALSHTGTTTSQSSGASKWSGSVNTYYAGVTSKVSGKVATAQNADGLSLRVNQIETCSAPTLKVYIAVADQAGQPSHNLTRDMISVAIDGNKVDSFRFSPINVYETPIANDLVIDHSGSMQGASLDAAKSAANAYIKRLLHDDSVGVIGFDSTVSVLQPISTDKQAASDAINKLTAGSNTSLYDAIGNAVGSVPSCGRKAVTVLTDGEDTSSSQYNEASVIAKANEVNVPVFAVGIASSDFSPASMTNIATSTGGSYLEASTPNDLAALYQKIYDQLTGQSVVEITPSFAVDNAEHRISVTAKINGSATTSERSFIFSKPSN